MHYHVIILGSPNCAFNHFGSKPYLFLDREINGNNKTHHSACECCPKESLEDTFRKYAWMQQDFPNLVTTLHMSKEIFHTC